MCQNNFKEEKLNEQDLEMAQPMVKKSEDEEIDELFENLRSQNMALKKIEEELFAQVERENKQDPKLSFTNKQNKTK